MATIVTSDQYVEVDGRLYEIKRQLRQKDGYPFNIARLAAALQALIEGRFDAIGGQFPSLTLVGTVVVRPMAKFSAMEFFNLNTKKNAPVAINHLGDNFTEWFLGKIEEGVGGEVALRYQTLNKGSLDTPIIAALGGETKAEMNLAVIADLMTKQAHGEEGTLITNGYANIFYVRNVNGVLCAVNVRWYGGGWYVYAYSVSNPSEWRAGRRVFSRDS